jgi:hypothetical protein
MISLPIEELPLLIKEKVKFYYDRQLWLNNIKIMHQQYEEKVVIIDYIPFDLILWRNKDPYNRMEYGIPICKTGVQHTDVDTTSLGNLEIKDALALQ